MNKYVLKQAEINDLFVYYSLVFNDIKIQTLILICSVF